jgi:hypothetical protein
LSVRYAFSPCDSYSRQTFHDGPLGPKEGRRGVKTSKGGWGRGAWVNFTQAIKNLSSLQA